MLSEALYTGIIGRGKPRPQPIHPLLLGSNLIEWWDGRRADLLTVNGSNLIETWTGAVTGIAPTQATEASRALWLPDQGGALFDGTADHLTTTVLAAIPVTDYEIWALVRQDALVADTGLRVAFSHGTSAQVSAYVGRGRIGAGPSNRARMSFSDGATAPTLTDKIANLSNRHIINAVIGASAQSIYVDGKFGFDTSSTLTTNTNARLRIGANAVATAAAFWQGIIYQILITTILPPWQKAGLLAYLQTIQAGYYA